LAIDYFVKVFWIADVGSLHGAKYLSVLRSYFSVQIDSICSTFICLVNHEKGRQIDLTSLHNK